MSESITPCVEPSPLIRALLEKRGIVDIDAYLNPSLAGLTSPDRLPGIVEAADAVLTAVAEGREIVVFGDYDCDGVSATAIVVRTLQALGGHVEPFLPKRLEEGYGMTDASVARMLAEYPRVGLVVTVDNGINSVEQIAMLKARGVSVVVTDHHLPGEELPAADAIANPKVAAPDDLVDICGAVVAFLLANRLVSEARRRGSYTGPNLGGPLLVLAGLATVTDIMPLLGQNRILVSEALKRFRSYAPIGLKELHSRAARNATEKLSSKDFGFMIGPRINAAGRLTSGMEALELVLSDDREIARECARIVDNYNAERKNIEQKMTEEALEKVVDGAAAQVIDLPDGHPGVAGIVAARVLERLGDSVPVCVLAGGHGSARSPEGLNIRDAFVACAEELDRFGGHAAAGGFSVRPGRVDAFREKLCAYCAEHNPNAGRPVPDMPEPELWINPSEATLELATEVARMEPFGERNEEPVFGFHDASISEIRAIGNEGRHLHIVLRCGLRGVWWGHGDRLEELRSGGSAPRDVLFNLLVSDYGERHVELKFTEIGKTK